jgi:hypothetical protein
MANKGKRGNVVKLKRILQKPGRKKPPAESVKTKVAKAKSVPAAGRSVTTEDNDAIRANFLQHRTAWTNVQAKLAVAQKLVKDVVSAAKADGFLKKEFEVADALAGLPKQEAKITGEVSLRLRVARWISHPMGDQLDLFAEPDRTPAVDRAYDEGKQACMSHERASPTYSPGIPQYTRWLQGYHDEQERQVKAGIKKLGGNGSLDDGPGEPDGEGNPVAMVGADPARPLSDFDEPMSDAKH